MIQHSRTIHRFYTVEGSRFQGLTFPRQERHAVKAHYKDMQGITEKKYQYLQAMLVLFSVILGNV